jgi:flagellin
MQESTNILQRMRELAIQSANDSNSSADRANLQKEVVQLQQELNRIAETTTFNGKKLLDGTFVSQKFQVGSNANETVNGSNGSDHWWHYQRYWRDDFFYSSKQQRFQPGKREYLS